MTDVLFASVKDIGTNDVTTVPPVTIGIGGGENNEDEGAGGDEKNNVAEKTQVMAPRRMPIGLSTNDVPSRLDGRGKRAGTARNTREGPTLGPDAPPGSVLPNVLLIGGQKSGTTALAEWLSDSEGVCLPRLFPGEPEHFAKEVQFFDRPDRYQGGIAFWARRFEHCRNLTLSMDATPNYLPFADRVQAVYDRLGEDARYSVRILLVLRDPVARELSLYNHKANLYRSGQSAAQEKFWSNVIRKDDGQLMPFREFVEQTTLRRMSRGLCDGQKIHRMQCYGMYARHLAKWMESFGHEQILVLSYEEMVENSAGFQRRVRSFLGLLEGRNGNGNGGGETIPHRNQQDNAGSKVELMPCDVRDRLEAAFSGPNDELYELLSTKNGPVMEQRPFPKFKPVSCTGSAGMI